ncbi:uncharacterized protein LOC123295663 isoform X2 [Chrysoperla carnea]|uniref:uncharacterized protein LOC123295663 isoform X2 n=1 Tax=Chrysoperla carnea TaxID=189513 RepID=UPI001D0964AC|nr:uncharacterized protein LOC123295663 isoform X2 [Chrysoperla carnea]
MPRKRIINPNHIEKLTQVNGLYIHSNPPRVLSINSNQIRHWIRIGDTDKLDQIVLEGKGAKLLGEYSPDNKIRTYLKSIPHFMSKIELVHDAVSGNSLPELQSLLNEDGGKRKLASCKDQAGVGLLHKAVYYDLPEIVHYLVDNYTYLINQKDKEGRTPCHYCAACRDPYGMMRILTNAGADSNVVDSKGHNPAYYIDHPVELELPQSPKTMAYLGIQKKPKEEGLVIKPSNIRIWIHQKDIGKLQKVLWEGHGNKLKVETSNNPKVKRFLESIPHIMALIKDIHTTVINDNLDAMKEKTAFPVPPIILSSKDSNGLTVLHKAVGLGRMEMVQYILDKCPSTLTICDNEGRTPLHYAATLKDQNEMYDYLIEQGADEAKLDNKQKTAGFYKNRPMDIDSKLLVVVPEAPRTPSSTFPPSWDWSLLGYSIANSTSNHKIEKLQDASKTKNGESSTPPQVNGDSNEHKENENNSENENTEPEKIDEDKIESEPPETNGDENKEEEVKEENTLDDEEHTTNGYIKSYEREPSVEEKENDTKENDTTDPEMNSKDEEVPETVNEENTNATENQETEKSIEKVEESHHDTNDDENVEKPDDNQENENSAEESTQQESANSEEQAEESGENVEENIDGILSSIQGNVTNENDEEKEDDDEDKNSERVIEGIVKGDEEKLNNDGQDPNFLSPTDDEIREMVETANMEQLAALVLNGDGNRLIGQVSPNPELQVFLDNVPSYMDKIKRVHIAAREGSLRDLQAALDRRKFAIAKDKGSPNGASPLHTAVIFGNTSIVRYLAGRFPETVQIEDDMGRTPLHYAATLADNGHYYNLLLHLGANAKTQDKLGHMAEYYRNNSEELSHQSLLMDYGVDEQVTTDLADRALGDPLIKGLTEVANKRPKDPIAYLATYLANFANSNTPNDTNPAVNNNHNIIPANNNITHELTINGTGNGQETNERPPQTIDVVTLEPDDPSQSPDAPQSAFSSPNRDEHGQSMLHFAAARSHGRNALFQLLEETDINIGYRDELYRTARDVSIQAHIPENTVEIDRWVLHVAARGDTDKLVELLLEGYDHILDVVDEEDKNIVEVVEERNQAATVAFLQSILAFEEKRERVHHAIRLGDLDIVRELLSDENGTGSGKLLAIGKNSYGRCTLHIAILCQHEEIADFIANTFPETLRIGDNLERTALHYAMGVEKVETISKVLIKAGAKRVLKDLKGRQASYYFMNKSDILRLQEEEETF